MLTLRRALIAAVLASLGLFFTAAGAGAFVGFQSPSHNIGCVIAKSGVRCDIKHRSWNAPPKPKSCPVDYGNGLSLSKRGKGTYTCAGDTVLGIGKALHFGHSVRRGRFRCASKRSGMRCTNLRNHHGFKLARQRVRLF